MNELIQSALERLQSSASVKNVYGEPIIAEGRTIVPVACVAYGFGGGSGKKGGDQQEGGGFGGGVRSGPAGVVEITPAGTRFVPANAYRQLAVAALAGFVAGLLYAKRR